MKTKRKLNRNLALGRQFRIVMAKKHLTFSDLSSKAAVSINTAYRLIERTPLIVTKPLLRIGEALGYQEAEIREWVRTEKSARGESYSEKDRFYQAISELIDLFEGKLQEGRR